MMTPETRFSAVGTRLDPLKLTQLSDLDSSSDIRVNFAHIPTNVSLKESGLVRLLLVNCADF